MMQHQLTEYTAPEVFAGGITEGWAEPITDPTTIDWPTRQAAALIPYDVINGRPVSPAAGLAPVARGRNQLGRWGENAMADAVVTLTDATGHLRVLLIERGDGGGWAVPGGKIEPGETPLQASVRELAEETGLVIPADMVQLDIPRWVPDPRGSDEAWAVTVAGRVHLGVVAELPHVIGTDDARRAAWVNCTNPAGATTVAALQAELARRYAGRIFAAHIDLLTEHLGA